MRRCSDELAHTHAVYSSRERRSKSNTFAMSNALECITIAIRNIARQCIPFASSDLWLQVALPVA